MRYIEICTLFDSLFSLSRTLIRKFTTKIIEILEIVIDKSMICCKNLTLSTKMGNIHSIEDHLLNQIKNTMVLDASLKIVLNKYINLA